jgi:hypothetical protein
MYIFNNMSIGVAFSYVLILFLSCIEFYFHYYFINYIRPDLTQKQKAYVLTIKSSLTLLLVGLYYNYYYFTSNFNETSFFNILEEKDSMNFGKLVVLYFTAYLLMDIYIGNKEYPEFMKSISGNFHHAVYTIVNMISLYIGVFPIYLLHMTSELPTFLLSLGSFDSYFRNDSLFGLTFFCTRIVYHIVLTYIFRNHSPIFYISLAALCLHIYWFYGWFQKYGKSLIIGDNNKKSSEKTPKTPKNKKTRKFKSV